MQMNLTAADIILLKRGLRALEDGLPDTDAPLETAIERMLERLTDAARRL